MPITTANCPSCGAPITFKIGSSIVVICEFCGSAIARTDRDLRNLGKVADLIDTRSPLRVGLEGRFDGQLFVLTGRVQVAHSAGGVWDEWYASFGGGQWWGWLAEAQGRFYMTFPRQVPNPAAIPPVNAVAPGQPIAIPGDQTPYVVAEVGAGRLMGAQGEIPYAVQPGLTYPFADVSGPNGAFATVDYRQAPPAVFSGREVTLKEMGISADVDEFDVEKRQIKVERLVCPHCNGPLELRAPDASLRVTCPNCNALLDVNRGNLTYLTTLEQPENQRYPIGASAIFDGVKLTIVGYMVRGCRVEGQWYYWEEYLLYDPSIGFRWIVNGEGGWFFVESIPAGDVQDHNTRVRFQNKSFMLKETVAAVVRYVRGEFYWRVEVGETTGATDYISRAETISKETGENEINWSFGRRLDVNALDRAFDPRTGPRNPIHLPPPRVVVPKKPLPSMWAAIGVWLVVTILSIVAMAAIHAVVPVRTVLNQTASFKEETAPPRPPQPPLPDSDSAVTWLPAKVEQTAVLGSFELTGSRGLEIEVTATPGMLGSLYLKMVNDATGEVRVESVGSVSRTWDKEFANPGAGTYTLYAIHQWTEEEPAVDVTVTIKEGAPDSNLILVPILMFGGLVLLAIMKVVRAAMSE